MPRPRARSGTGGRSRAPPRERPGWCTTARSWPWPCPGATSSTRRWCCARAGRRLAPMPTDRLKRLTLVACLLGSSIALLDGTIVSVALPAIGRDLGGGLAGQQWVVNGYLLALGSLILVGGSLGDVYGERRIFALGVSGFGVASVLCAVAPSVGFLVGARALQGVASALLTPA